MKPRKAFTRHSPSVDHLFPGCVLDISYCYYVAAENHQAKSVTAKRAHDVVAEFERLCNAFPKNSPEGVFLFTISQIIVSLSRAIIRGKRNLESQRRIAEKERKERLNDISKAGRQAGIFNAGWRVFLMAGLGFFLAEAFFPEANLKEGANPTYVSLATSIVTVMIGTYLRSWFVSQKVTRIFLAYHHSVMFAEKKYEIDIFEEYQRAKQSATIAWKHLTGSLPPEVPGFEELLQEQIKSRVKFEREAQIILANPFWGMLLSVFDVLKRIRLRRGKKK
jgi:hypothetical protein